eukprot:330436-Pyramimonas_sp.AAC.2
MLAASDLADLLSVPVGQGNPRPQVLVPGVMGVDYTVECCTASLRTDLVCRRCVLCAGGTLVYKLYACLTSTLLLTSVPCVVPNRRGALFSPLLVQESSI